MSERLFRFQASPEYDCYTIIYAWHKKRRVLRELFARAVAGLDGSSLRLLDIGCGDGYDLFMLRQMPEAVRFSSLAGLDLNAADIAYCRERAAYEGDPRMEFQVRDVVNEPLGASERADVIICSEVVEHLVEPGRLIAGLAGVLPAGGSLILTTPNGVAWSSRLRLRRPTVSQTSPAPLSEGESFGHISVRGRKAWRALCRECGLRLVAERRGSLLYGSPALDRRRWLGGLAIALDGLADAMRLNELSWETIQLYQREG